MRGAVEDRFSGPVNSCSSAMAPAGGHPPGAITAFGCALPATGSRTGYADGVHRIFGLPFASVYPLYAAKLERKGRTTVELDEVIEWLTGFDDARLREHLDAGTTFEDFFADAELNPAASSITGVVCGVRVEEIDDPLMQRIRYLDKLVDELAKGRPMEKVLRAA